MHLLFLWVCLKYCNEYMVEVGRELNYTVIGQVVTYRYLYYKHSWGMAKPMIICGEG